VLNTQPARSRSNKATAAAKEQFLFDKIFLINNLK
jgi:hypothetical protein